MMKLLATIMVAFQKVCDLFSDDEDYDPSWMDYSSWRKTRI